MKSLFREFVDHKERENRRHLKIIKKLLEAKDFKVKGYVETDDPYIFVASTNKKTSFNGIRVYHIGSQIAFRVQNEADTHPYGKAYPLDIEEMFNDLLSDNKPKEAAQKVMTEVVREIKRFFDSSAKAEGEFEDATDPLDRLITKSTGTDYSNNLMTRMG